MIVHFSIPLPRFPRLSPRARQLAIDLGEGLAVFVGALIVAAIGLAVGFCLALGG
jgi:hypothetical protein